MLTSLKGWWRASDVTTVTGTVSAMLDLSGNGNHLAQAVAGARPTYGSVQLNGQDVLTFDGGDYLDVTFGATLSQPITVGLVVRLTSVAAIHNMTGGPTATEVAVRQIISAARWGLAAGTPLNGGTPSAGTWYKLIAVFNGASSRLEVNGSVVVGPGSCGATGAAGFRLGGTASLSAPHVGDIAEAFVTNAAISASELTAVANYWSKRWAL